MGGLVASLLVIAAQPAGGDRAVIPDVPYMGPRWQEFLDGPQDFSFPSSMAAAMAYVDEDHPYDYRAYMAICGISFRQCWNPDQAEVTFDNIWIQDDDPSEPLRRCFDAAGFGYQLLINDDVEPDQSLPAATPGERVSASGLKDAVIASIGAGQPVIGVSAFGPHVIAGYDEGGDVALGWGQCGGMDERPEEDASGYLAFPSWLRDTAAVVLIGHRTDRPDVDDVYREWLRWAVEGMRQPAVAGRATGLASFDAWTAALAPGEPLPGDLQGDHLQQRVGVHDLHALGIAEGRAFGGELLERAAGRFADAREPLSDAAECCWEMHDLIWCLWGVLGGHGPPAEEQCDRFSEPQVRAELARTVGMLAELDAQVVRSMEVALHRIGEPLADVPNALSVDDADPDTALGWRPDHGHENMDIWIRGAPAMGWGQGTDHQDVAVLAAALAPTERPAAYNDLMGYSGAAFGIDWAGGREANPAQAIATATGWALGVRQPTAGDLVLARKALTTDVIRSIRAGRPVIVRCDGDPGLVLGYHIHSMSFLVRPWDHQGEALLRIPHDDRRLEYPWVFLEGPHEAAAPEEALRRALLAASEAGTSALQRWRDALAQEVPDANAGALARLIDARRSAVEFLDRRLGLLGADARANLQRAVQAYHDELTELEGFIASHPQAADPQADGRGTLTDAVRAEQVELLARCIELEQAAQAALVEALRAGG